MINTPEALPIFFGTSRSPSPANRFPCNSHSFFRNGAYVKTSAHLPALAACLLLLLQPSTAALTQTYAPYPAADLALGQADFASKGRLDPPSVASLAAPRGIAISP